MHISLEDEERDLLVFFLLSALALTSLLLVYRLIRRSTSRLLTPIVGLGLLVGGQSQSTTTPPKRTGGPSKAQHPSDVFLLTPNFKSELTRDPYAILQTIYLSPSRVAHSLRHAARKISSDEWGTVHGFFPIPYWRIWLDSPWAMGLVEVWYAGLGESPEGQASPVGRRSDKSPKLGDVPVFDIGRDRKASPLSGTSTLPAGRTVSMNKDLRIQIPAPVRHPSPTNSGGLPYFGYTPDTSEAAITGTASGYVTPTEESSNPMDGLGFGLGMGIPTNDANRLSVSPSANAYTTPIAPSARATRRRNSLSPRADSDGEGTTGDDGADGDEDERGLSFGRKETGHTSPVLGSGRERSRDVGAGLAVMSSNTTRRQRSPSTTSAHSSSHDDDEKEVFLRSPRSPIVGPFGSPGGSTTGPILSSTTSTSQRQLAIKAFYTLGCLAAIIGMTIAISLVAWQAFSSWFGIYRVVLSRILHAQNRPVEGIAGEMIDAVVDVVVRKRSMESASSEAMMYTGDQVDAAALASMGALPKAEGLQFAAGWKWSMGGGMGGFTGSVIQPIIPGVTVPLAHVIPLLLALFSSQIVHELGHVGAAAIDGIHPLQIAATLHFVLPNASVLLPSGVSLMPALSRIRMAAGGPWHNFANYFVILLIGWSGVTQIFYNDFTQDGRVVLGLQAGSPLEGHLPAGAIVEYLDDVAISGKLDMWSQYLLSDEQDETRGWCVDKKRYQSTLQAPCPDNAPIEFTMFPYSDATNEIAHCLPAYPLLTTRTWECPCTSSFQVCVKPTPASNVMRIQWVRQEELSLPRGKRSSSVLLWSGARDEVWRSVRVSRYAGRGGWLGRRFAMIVELLCGYVSTLSLTLFLLNLLPIPSLDGAHVLEALLDLQYPNTRTVKDRSESPITTEGTFATEKEDLPDSKGEDARPGASEEYRNRRRIQYLITWGTAGLVALSVGGMMVTLGLQYSA